MKNPEFSSKVMMNFIKNFRTIHHKIRHVILYYCKLSKFLDQFTEKKIVDILNLSVSSSLKPKKHKKHFSSFNCSKIKWYYSYPCRFHSSLVKKMAKTARVRRIAHIIYQVSLLAPEGANIISCACKREEKRI